MRNSLFRTGAATVAGLITVAAMASQASAATGAAAATKAAQPHVSAVSYGPGHWVQVTAAQESISDVGLSRGNDGVLHVLWTTANASADQSVIDSPIAANGKPGTRVTLASGVGSASGPDATVTPSGIDAFYSGITTAGEFTYEKVRPLSGGDWSPGVTVSALPEIANQGSVSTATGGDGKPWFAYAGDALVVDHLGQPEKEIEDQCCTSNPGLATDGKSGVTYLVYQASTSHLKGIYVQRMGTATAAGSPARLPDSSTDALENQRIGITGRGHGRSGVYVAYELSTPSLYQAVGVIQAGSATPVKLATNFSPLGEILAGETISAAPNGRLWVTWYDGEGSPAALFVRVSGSSGLSFGPTARVALPSGTSTIWKVYTSAQNGREDVVALLTVHGKTAYFATQVLLPVVKKATATPAESAATAALAAAASPDASESWHVSKSMPGGSKGISFTSVVATGKNTAWAFSGNAGAVEPTAWRLNGSTWTKASFPGKGDEEVDLAEATSPSDVWAFTSDGRVLSWNGHAWSVKANFGDVISAATVLAPNDVWVFGVLNGQWNVYHYNGHTWTWTGKDVASGSALGPHDAWGVFDTYAVRWNGSTWLQTNLAGLLPTATSSNDPSLTGILALSASNVYAVGNGFADNGCGPSVILHYNGQSWRRVATANLGCGPLSQEIVPDGHGGLWLPMRSIQAQVDRLVHYSDGKLTQAALPGGWQRYVINWVSQMPGTDHELAAGFIHANVNSAVSLTAVLLQYS